VYDVRALSSSDCRGVDAKHITGPRARPASQPAKRASPVLVASRGPGPDPSPRPGDATLTTLRLGLHAFRKLIAFPGPGLALAPSTYHRYHRTSSTYRASSKCSRINAYCDESHPISEFGPRYHLVNIRSNRRLMCPHPSTPSHGSHLSAADNSLFSFRIMLAGVRKHTAPTQTAGFVDGPRQIPRAKQSRHYL